MTIPCYYRSSKIPRMNWKMFLFLWRLCILYFKDFFHLICFQFGVSKDPSFIPSQRNSRAGHSAAAGIGTAPSHQAREPGSHENRPNNSRTTLNENQRLESDMQVKSHNTKQNRSPAAEQTKASFETDDCEMIEILPNDKSNELAKRKRKSNEKHKCKNGINNNNNRKYIFIPFQVVSFKKTRLPKMKDLKWGCCNLSASTITFKKWRDVCNGVIVFFNLQI